MIRDPSGVPLPATTAMPLQQSAATMADRIRATCIIENAQPEPAGFCSFVSHNLFSQTRRLVFGSMNNSFTLAHQFGRSVL
jgi:hypothetical protein